MFNRHIGGAQLRSKALSSLVAGGLLFGGQVSLAQVPVSECLKADGTSGVISSLAASYSISQPGTYCLSRDISFNLTNGSSTVSAIIVAASNVTLDFNGHSVKGLYSSGVPGAYNGQEAVTITSGAKNVVVRNGTIAGFHTAIAAWTNGGSNPVTNLLIEDMQLLYTARIAIDLAAFNTTCTDCTVQNTIIKNLDYSLCTTCLANTGSTWVKAISVGSGARAQILNNYVSMKELSGGYGSSAIAVFAANSRIEGNTVESESVSKLDKGISVSGNNIIVANNRITNMKNGVIYSSATGPYSGNMTVNTTTPYTGGTPYGLNF
jgi:hypothetical protein